MASRVASKAGARSPFPARTGGAAASFAAAPPVRAGKGDRAPAFEATREAMRRILEGPDRLPLPLERVRAELRAHYVEGNAPLYWAGTGRMTPFLQRLADAEDDGLRPEDYPVDTLLTVRDLIDASDVVTAAQAEIYYAAFFLQYASDMKVGRFIPQKIDPNYFTAHRTVDSLAILGELMRYRLPTQYLDVLEPANPHYRALKELLVEYRALAAKGGWRTVSPGSTLKPGDRDRRVEEMRELLAATGDYRGGGATGVYDEALVKAVRQFQVRHGLDSEGVVGKQTLIAMNVPAEERVRQIVVNLERWRWAPERMGNRYIMVNIAGYELFRVEYDRIMQKMPVVVGKTYTRTPAFSDEMEYIEFNPTWTVPYSIATKEMLPKLRTNPYALGDEFDVFVGGRLSDFGSVDWNAVGPGNFPVTFRQKPGPKNALGRAKFMLPNKYNIYLHDTPSRSTFDDTVRTFSHGCVRLSRPIELADAILRDQRPDWTPSRVEAVLASGKTTRVDLPEHIPVHIIYATAWRGENGLVHFRPDIYGGDRKLYAALFAQHAA